MSDPNTYPAHRKEPERKCAACGGEMEEGRILSPSIGPVWGEVGHPNEAAWYAGRASGGVFGHELPKRHFPLTAVRCTKCGRVELFAG